MKQKDILIIVFLLFIFVLVWIGGSIYHSAVSSTISEDVSQNIAPIDPTFDMKTINNIKSREKIVPLFDLQSVAPTPVVLPNLPPPPSASQGGSLML